MGSTCCADRATETGVQERPQIWCAVLTQQAKAPVLILHQCLSCADISLDCQKSHKLAF